MSEAMVSVSAETLEQMVSAAQSALKLIVDNWPFDHGQMAVGLAWGGMVSTIIEGRELLYPDRRYVAQPCRSGSGWEVLDKAHPLGSRTVTGEFPIEEALRVERRLNEEAATGQAKVGELMGSGAGRKLCEKK